MITVGEARVYNMGPLERIPVGEGRTVRVAGEEIAIVRARSGEVFAVQAACPHRGGPLADGIVGGGKIVCPLHAYAFDLRTGESAREACPALRTYEVAVSPAGELVVRLTPRREVHDG